MKSPPKSSEGLCLLSLDGGGVKGLSSLLILNKLMYQLDNQNPPKPCEIFDMIGGTSTGGLEYSHVYWNRANKFSLLAIMLGRLEMSVDDCIDAYVTLSERIFQKNFWPCDWVDWKGNIRSRFSSRELENAIKDIVEIQCGNPDEALLIDEEPRCRVFVCAKSSLNARTVLFQNYQTSGEPVNFPDVKIWQAARATSAAATFFDPITLGVYREEFIDGATGCNNPVREVWSAASDVWPTESSFSFKQSIKCLVSIGTGIAVDKNFARRVFQVTGTLSDIATETEDTAASFEREHRDMCKEQRYFRFNVSNGLGTIGLEDYAKMGEISARTEKYLRSLAVAEEIRACSKMLWKMEMNNVNESAMEKRPSLGRYKASDSTVKHHRSPRRTNCCQPVLWTIALLLFAVLIVLLPNPETKAEDSLDHRAPIIAIMGKTGVGKSTFINILGGRNIDNKTQAAAVGHTLESCTYNLTWYEANVTGERVYLIDTPGFDDSRIPDSDILIMISQELARYYRSDKLLTGIIYLHDISQPRIGGLAKRNFAIFERLVGKGAFENVVLVTTKWLKRPMQDEEFHQLAREDELKHKYWKQMLHGGSTIMRHDNSAISARRIVIHLRDKPKVVLQNQRELVDDEMHFADTAAGQAVTDELPDSYYKMEPAEYVLSKGGSLSKKDPKQEQKSSKPEKDSSNDESSYSYWIVFLILVCAVSIIGVCIVV